MLLSLLRKVNQLILNSSGSIKLASAYLTFGWVLICLSLLRSVDCHLLPSCLPSLHNRCLLCLLLLAFQLCFLSVTGMWSTLYCFCFSLYIYGGSLFRLKRKCDDCQRLLCFLCVRKGSLGDDILEDNPYFQLTDPLWLTFSINYLIRTEVFIQPMTHCVTMVSKPQYMVMYRTTMV